MCQIIKNDINIIINDKNPRIQFFGIVFLNKKEEKLNFLIIAIRAIIMIITAKADRTKSNVIKQNKIINKLLIL
ncbi:unnamed protein product [marine sediment metagenome]|uniref:Uncharacterized protein n=1 Tax=marine sediment metagenome TaxID=412755 RepID=X0YFJ2_9ZZZZ